MPRFIDAEQGSEEWMKARLGVITGSKASKLFNTLKSGKYSASRADEAMTIAFERIAAASGPNATSRSMERGHEFEPAARMAYAFETMQTVQEVGLCLHDERDDWGGSFDGLVGVNGVLEIKVPTNLAKQVKYVLDPQELLNEYAEQCRHNLFISGRDWIDICSYTPEATQGLHIAVARMERPASWAAYKHELEKVGAEIQAICDRLSDRMKEAA